jgi:hypothetical protein
MEVSVEPDEAGIRKTGVCDYHLVWKESFEQSFHLSDATAEQMTLSCSHRFVHIFQKGCAWIFFYKQTQEALGFG